MASNDRVRYVCVYGWLVEWVDGWMDGKRQVSLPKDAVCSDTKVWTSKVMLRWQWARGLTGSG